MIESQLGCEKHAWYELEEHSLQTKFEVGELIWNELVHEVAK